MALPGRLRLAKWGIFNPMGPTASVLDALLVPGQDAAVLLFAMANPFASEFCAYGAVPANDVRNGDRLVEVLKPLFARDGSEEVRLFGSLPTHVVVEPTSPLNAGQLRELVLAAAEEIDDRDDLERTCAMLVAYRGDPWARTQAELQAALGRPTTPPPPSVGSEEGGLAHWWQLVTDPVHVESEASQMEHAWRGAIEFAGRGSRRTGAAP